MAETKEETVEAVGGSEVYPSTRYHHETGRYRRVETRKDDLDLGDGWKDMPWPGFPEPPEKEKAGADGDGEDTGEITTETRAQSAKILTDAQERAEKIVADAEARAKQILENAGKKAAEIIKKAKKGQE